MDFAIADLLELPLLRTAQVINEGAFDPYRAVAAPLLSGHSPAGHGLFQPLDAPSLLGALSETNGWPVLCIVGSGGDGPSGPGFDSIRRPAAARRTALLWLETD